MTVICLSVRLIYRVSMKSLPQAHVAAEHKIGISLTLSNNNKPTFSCYTMDEDNQSTSDLKSYLNKTLINTLEKGTYFTLSNQTIKSLDILPKLKPDGTPDNSSYPGASSRSNTTVYSVLNKCRTVSGQRLLAIWLQNPLKSKEKIDLRQEIVDHFVVNTELRAICYEDYLKKIHDLLRISHKVHKEKCNLNDLIKVYNSCKALATLNGTFNQSLKVSNINASDAVHKLFGWARASCEELKDFMELIEGSVDLDNVDETGEYMIKPNSDEDIARVSLEINNVVAQARRQLSVVSEDLGLESGKGVKLETDSEKGFAFRVTKQNEQVVRGNRDYEQLSLVKKDGYRFTDKTLTKLSAKYVNAKDDYNSLAKNVIEDIISKAVMYDNEVLDFAMVVTLIDVFVSLSIAAIQNNYVKPLILEPSYGKMSIEKLRHPCVENQPDIENYVPNDIEMSKDDKKFYMITGPNMGGKSTFIKSVAVVAIMAQCGSMVPAEEARISVLDGVFTRVGAGDKQMEGISTFMEEMMDISTILKEAKENSLVIIDELGRGTSTFDGFGLAWAISKHLATQIKSYTLFATHFHELTEMEQDFPIVGNLYVKALCQADKLTMLYNVDKGICDESYGINVAEFTRFPEHVIKQAREKLKQFEEVPGFCQKKEVGEFIRECTKEYLTK